MNTIEFGSDAANTQIFPAEATNTLALPTLPDYDVLHRMTGDIFTEEFPPVSRDIVRAVLGGSVYDGTRKPSHAVVYGSPYDEQIRKPTDINILPPIFWQDIIAAKLYPEAVIVHGVRLVTHRI